MTSKQIHERGVLAKLLEQGTRILLTNECNSIGNIKVEIIASSIEIIKGKLQKVIINATGINYKDLLFDEIELESNQIKVDFKLRNKQLNFRSDLIIQFKISLSENSLKEVLLSNSWNWIGNMISKEILNNGKLEDIKIRNNKLYMKFSKKNIAVVESDHINIKAEMGKIYLNNEKYNKFFKIPIEEKIYIESINIVNNLINISANSPINF